jgi:hypothetical protein
MADRRLASATAEENNGQQEDQVAAVYELANL